MDAHVRTEPRTSSIPRIEIASLAVVAVGFVVMTLGILEIGGLFNVVLGLMLIEVGSVILFAEEGWKRASRSCVSSTSSEPKG